ncbi:MAG TPA: SMC-Scp complex subunit ScpB [Pseudogracilibacillus sp.]|nr:SMC-Scp complex subunit ScpB [Pseudogracilibacillus sp.]
MSELNLKAVLEGLLFSSGHEGITVKQISDVLEITPSDVNYLIEELSFDYEYANRGIKISESQNKYYLTTKPEHNIYYKRMLESPNQAKLSQAALETLAIIAYNQPITRVEIEEIRGVNSDRAVQTLVARSLIEEKGKKDSVGKPILFGTSIDFLTFFGLSNIEDLPQLPEDVNQQIIEKEADLFLQTKDKTN